MQAFISERLTINRVVQRLGTAQDHINGESLFILAFMWVYANDACTDQRLDGYTPRCFHLVRNRLVNAEMVVYSTRGFEKSFGQDDVHIQQFVAINDMSKLEHEALYITILLVFDCSAYSFVQLAIVEGEANIVLKGGRFKSLSRQ
jgi:hypothetical protein